VEGFVVASFLFLYFSSETDAGFDEEFSNFNLLSQLSIIANVVIHRAKQQTLKTRDYRTMET
jgi:hypothetical protein